MSTQGESVALRPLELLAALDRERVYYVVIGAFAALVHGSGLPTAAIDVTPSLREMNMEPLRRALAELGAERTDGRPLVVERETLQAETVTRLRTQAGPLTLVPLPAGTRGGYDDLRRQATREPLGGGLRPPIASLPDVVRSLAALGREEDLPRLLRLRRLMELERTLQRRREPEREWERDQGLDLGL